MQLSHRVVSHWGQWINSWDRPRYRIANAFTSANPNLWSLDLDLLPRNPWRHPHTAKVVHEINLTPHFPRLAWLDPAGYEIEVVMQGHEPRNLVAASRRRGRVSGYDAERRCVAATLGEEPCKPIGGSAIAIGVETKRHTIAGSAQGTKAWKKKYSSPNSKYS